MGTGTGVLPRNMYRYGAKWTGTDISENQIEQAKSFQKGETIHPILIPDCYPENFELAYHEEYPLEALLTRDSWYGKIKACRGIGTSLSGEEITILEQEHRSLLAEIAPAEFNVLHYRAIAELKKK